MADLVYLSMMLDDFGPGTSSLSLTCRASCTVAYSSELPGPVAQLLLELVTLLASAWKHRQTDRQTACHFKTLSLHDK